MRNARCARSPWVGATTLIVTTTACDPAEIHNLHTLHTDSAGIPIVTAVAPLWEPGDAWTVDPEPLVEIGTVSRRTSSTSSAKS